MTQTSKEEVADIDWHSLNPEQALSRLDSSEDGLAAGEVRERQASWGPSTLPEEDRPGALRIFLRQFRDPLVYVLLIAALVSLGLGNIANASFIGAVLLINAIVGALQEGRAEASASALQEMMRVCAQVLRDGCEEHIDATALVPGDVVLLPQGESQAPPLVLKLRRFTRQLAAVEGLGSCTLIASDKTGTLTENMLTIQWLELPDGEPWEVSGEGYSTDGRIHADDGEPEGDSAARIERLVRAGMLCNDASISFDEDGEASHTEGDSVDLSFLVLGGKAGKERRPSNASADAGIRPVYG